MNYRTPYYIGYKRNLLYLVRKALFCCKLIIQSRNEQNKTSKKNILCEMLFFGVSCK